MSNIKEIIDCLNNDGVLLVPTDTVYGLAIKPESELAIDKLYQLKSRPKSVNLPIMVHSPQAIEELGVELSDDAKKLLNSDLVPGALTLALGFKDQPTKEWLKGREEVAIRIPDDQNLLAILEKFGPLLVTSANKHGNKTPNNVIAILNDLEGKPDFVIDDGIRNETPSTLVNCRVNPPVIEREGAIPSAVIQQILNHE
jgi:L-threonylcarbamoyladenylate synthase